MIIVSRVKSQVVWEGGRGAGWLVCLVMGLAVMISASRVVKLNLQSAYDDGIGE